MENKEINAFFSVVKRILIQDKEDLLVSDEVRMILLYRKGVECAFGVIIKGVTNTMKAFEVEYKIKRYTKIHIAIWGETSFRECHKGIIASDYTTSIILKKS